MKTLSFQVAEISAPLDLILQLLSRNKLTITDIDISSLLEQYMQTIRTWQEQDLEIASDFLEMASRLIYMKTVSLLPRHREESERLRQDLAGELMEYQACKAAARLLGESSRSMDSFGRPPAPIDADQAYRLTHVADILFEALGGAVGKGARRRPPEKERFQSILARPVVSVNQKVFWVLRRLRGDTQIKMDDLFLPEAGRSGLVATFLAVLELVKAGRIEIRQDAVLMKRGKP